MNAQQSQVQSRFSPMGSLLCKFLALSGFGLMAVAGGCQEPAGQVRTDQRSEPVRVMLDVPGASEQLATQNVATLATLNNPTIGQDQAPSSVPTPGLARVSVLSRADWSVDGKMLVVAGDPDWVMSGGMAPALASGVDSSNSAWVHMFVMPMGDGGTEPRRVALGRSFAESVPVLCQSADGKFVFVACGGLLHRVATDGKGAALQVKLSDAPGTTITSLDTQVLRTGMSSYALPSGVVLATMNASSATASPAHARTNEHPLMLVDNAAFTFGQEPISWSWADLNIEPGHLIGAVFTDGGKRIAVASNARFEGSLRPMIARYNLVLDAQRVPTIVPDGQLMLEGGALHGGQLGPVVLHDEGGIAVVQDVQSSGQGKVITVVRRGGQRSVPVGMGVAMALHPTRNLLAVVAGGDAPKLLIIDASDAGQGKEQGPRVVAMTPLRTMPGGIAWDTSGQGAGQDRGVGRVLVCELVASDRRAKTGELSYFTLENWPANPTLIESATNLGVGLGPLDVLILR